MKQTTTTRYDIAEHLRTPEEMAAYLEACLEEAGGDAAFIPRAKGMAHVAREAGLSRESLYKALFGERSADFGTILKVISALGLRLHAQALTRRSVRSAPRSGGRGGKGTSGLILLTGYSSTSHVMKLGPDTYQIEAS